MMQERTILMIGTYDTKEDELAFLRGVIEAQGGKVCALDISVLGDTAMPVEISKHQVAEAAGTTMAGVIASGDEATAMELMSLGAVRLARDLVDSGACHGMIALGGTMGTDLALDVALALPLGVPKYIVSTVAFSPIIPPDRLPADIQMILWSGGLYGLNAICRSALAQAAGAVLGAARAAIPLDRSMPLVGVTSLGNSCLKYMKRLKPALAARGFDTAFFHSTSMGGRAFEGLAAQGAFCCVMDLCLQEFGNAQHGSIVSSGASRLQSAGRAGVPQIVAPGATDMVDLPTWRPIPEVFASSPLHVHNKLITSVMLDGPARRKTARAAGECLNAAKGPTHVILPLLGIEEWDREGDGLHDPAALAEFMDEFRTTLKAPVQVTEIDAHINDEAFVAAVLVVFDDWVARGIVRAG